VVLYAGLAMMLRIPEIQTARSLLARRLRRGAR